MYAEIENKNVPEQDCTGSSLSCGWQFTLYTTACVIATGFRSDSIHQRGISNGAGNKLQTPI
jgi:hypothetical protein